MQKGDFVRIGYTGRIKGSNVLFDTTDEALARKENAFNKNARYGPMAIIVGEKRVLKGLDEAILEMHVKEKKHIEVPPEKAFGQRDGNLLKTFPISQFRNQNIDPLPGMLVTMNNALGKVLSVSSGRVRLDFNHPLAGKTLMYEIEVKEKLEKDGDKAASILEFYTGSSGIVKISGEEAIINSDASQEAKGAVSKDVMKYLPLIKRVKFEEVFEAKAEEKKGKK